MIKKLLFLSVLVLLTTPALASEEYSLTDTVHDVAANKTHITITYETGEPIEPDSWPLGYSISKDGSFIIPGGFIILPDGRIETSGSILPKGNLPKGFTQVAHGAIETPEGIIINPKNANIQKEKPIKNEQHPEIWKMLPMVDNQQVTDNITDPQDVNKQRKGKTLSIPEDAHKKKDFSFLKGCWHTKDLPGYVNSWNNPKRPPDKYEADLCFKGQGNGSFLPKLHSGHVCRGSAKATFNGKTLRLVGVKAKCPATAKYNAYAPRTFDCVGTDEDTICYVSAINPLNSKDIRKSRITLRKK
jgi:hypothetical protein